jgi:hypothetical protein
MSETYHEVPEPGTCLVSREIRNMGTENDLVTRRGSRVPREFVDAMMMVWTRAVRWRAERV